MHELTLLVMVGVPVAPMPPSPRRMPPGIADGAGRLPWGTDRMLLMTPLPCPSRRDAAALPPDG
jgi:hypothetical protein